MINWDPSYQSGQSFEDTMRAAGWRLNDHGTWTKTTVLTDMVTKADHDAVVAAYEAEIAKSDAQNQALRAQLELTYKKGDRLEGLRTELTDLRQRLADMAECRFTTSSCVSCLATMEAWRG